MLVKAANEKMYKEDLNFICGFYKEGLEQEQLKLQLDVMASNLPWEQAAHNLQSVLKYLREVSHPQRGLLPEVCILAQLLLVMPATNAVSERSFSSLRRIKTYLRSTMTQTRLNSIMTLHIHKELTEKLNVSEIGNEFLGPSEHRLTLFGKFLPTD